MIFFNKKIGETPLQAINRFKSRFPEYIDKKISYAGRLDPMASGLLLLLIDEENKNRKRYEKMDKEYLFEVLFGISTDSGDILGLIDKSVKKVDTSKAKLKNTLGLIKARKYQFPPKFSSVPVNGKPLYYWAKRKQIYKIKIPKRKVIVYSIKLIDYSDISFKKLKNLILKRVKLVEGDFRQNEILKAWKKYFISTTFISFKLAKIKIKCSSGTYIRSIAEDIGKILKIPSLALNIKRTEIMDKGLERNKRL